MPGSRTRRAVLAGAALGGGGVAAIAARLAQRRRELRWSPAQRQLRSPYLSVQVVGEGDSPVVLLHPLAGSASYFGAAFDELGQPGPLLVPDLLGFGASPRAARDYGPDEQVEAVLRSLDGLGIEEPALFVGHDLGAVIALRAAVTKPERVREVVAISPLIYGEGEAARERLRQLSPTELGGPLDRNLARAIYSGPGPRAGIAGRMARVWRLDLPGGADVSPEGTEETVYRLILENCVFRAEPAGWVTDLAVPVHFVLPAHDPVPDSRLLAELADRYANVTLAVLPFGDHRLPLTHPDGCLAAIDRFRSHLGAPSSAPAQAPAGVSD